MTRLVIFSYAVLLVLFTIFSYLFIDANFIYLKQFFTGFSNQHRSLITVFYTSFVLLFFVFYLLFFYLERRKLLTQEAIKKVIFISVLILVFSYPAMLSYDIFNYVATAKVIYHYGENPYIIMPTELIGDPVLLFTHAANKIALYGPAWILISGIPYVLGMRNFLLTLFSFKLFIVTFYLGTVFVLWKMTKSIKSVVFFALNPLVLIESIVSVHNDIVMMFLALLSMFLLIKGKVWQSLILLLLSIFIKYATLFLIPLYIFIAWKQYRGEKVEWGKMYFAAFLSMLAIFFLSPLREEIYPWYAIWFLTFSSLLIKNKTIKVLSIAFSLTLMLRYIPFILLGTHFGITPAVKTLLTFLPVILTAFFLFFRSHIRLGKFF